MTEAKAMTNTGTDCSEKPGDLDETARLLKEYAEILSDGLSSKKWYELNDDIRGALNVGIDDFFQREAYRGLRQFGGIDCEIYMISSYGKKDIDKLIVEIGMKEFDFRITANGKIFNLKIMIQENSPCSILLCEDFANTIIKSINPRQRYKEFKPSEIKMESVNFTYSVEVEGGASEVIILNIQKV